MTKLIGSARVSTKSETTDQQFSDPLAAGVRRPRPVVWELRQRSWLGFPLTPGRKRPSAAGHPSWRLFLTNPPLRCTASETWMPTSTSSP
ncbi:hypothetical protein [Cryobacterium sp. Hh7]|uniref:hypothetical protein n=1 Tax=Cryobacterium sp. Hh7 TaxID=1259159 RepID=UPI00158436F5|nr:hypothetical protein [Cryobacterium sp. Hh7]